MEIVQMIKTINTVISVAKPILESVTPKLQETMKGFAERILELSEKYPSIAEFAQMIEKASDITVDVLYVLGINADSASIMGAKITQADKSIDDFASIDEYISYIKNEIELDKEKFATLSNEERVVYSIIGMSVEVSVIGEKLGVYIPADIVELVAKVAEIGKIVVEAKELVSLISAMRDNGIENLSDICDCIKGEGNSDRLRTSEKLLKVLDGIKPGEGNEILNEIIDEIRE